MDNVIWTPLAKGIYEAASDSGWSLLELANRMGVSAEALESGVIGVAGIKQLEELTGWSELNIRRVGLGLSPIKGGPDTTSDFYHT